MFCLVIVDDIVQLFLLFAFYMQFVLQPFVVFFVVSSLYAIFIATFVVCLVSGLHAFIICNNMCSFPLHVYACMLSKCSYFLFSFLSLSLSL